MLCRTFFIQTAANIEFMQNNTLSHSMQLDLHLCFLDIQNLFAMFRSLSLTGQVIAMSYHGQTLPVLQILHGFY